MRNVIRRSAGALIALALALVAAAPVAAAQPTRTIVHLDTVQHYAAGEGCDFDVTVYLTPGSQYTETDFADGTVAYVSHQVHREITNDANGRVFVESSIFHEVDRMNGDLDLGTLSGQFVYQFYPGDIGPGGVVLDHLLALFMTGRATYAVNTQTGATVAFTLVGQSTDICRSIS